MVRLKGRSTATQRHMPLHYLKGSVELVSGSKVAETASLCTETVDAINKRTVDEQSILMLKFTVNKEGLHYLPGTINS